MTSVSNLLTGKIVAAVIVIGALLTLFGIGYYFGYVSRQDEINEGVEALIVCQTGVEMQNAAVRRLQAAGDAQNEKILKAQAEAAKLRRQPLIRREPPPNDCEGAMAWGKVRAEELSRGW